MTAMLSYGTEKFFAEDVFLDEIDEDEVLVKIKAVGICHTDIASTESIYPFSYPVLLGHEGAGIVEKVGKNVINVSPGDHVVLVYASCGKCDHCIQGMPYICDEFYCLNTKGVSKHNQKKLALANGEKVSNFFGQSSFAEYSIVNQNSVVKVDKELPLDYLGPLACGLMTGFGSVLEKLQPKKNESIAVFGCGAVGLSSIIASKIAGCKEIIAIDVSNKKLEFAKQFGATHVINSENESVKDMISSYLTKGVHYAVESTGHPAVLQEALEITRLSGKIVVLSAVKSGTKIELDYKSIQSERSLIGTIMGSVNPHLFIPRLIEFYKNGQLPLEKLITFYRLKDINEAIQDIKNGKVIKAVLKI
jgi:aryl-alcohol dehydrogenase